MKFFSHLWKMILISSMVVVVSLSIKNEDDPLSGARQSPIGEIESQHFVPPQKKIPSTGGGGGKIIDGTISTFLTFVALVSWRTTDSETAGFCSGAFLSETVVLTAAHCVDFDQNNHEFSVYRTASIKDVFQMEGDVSRYHVRQIMVHPSYDSSYWVYDVAILMVEHSIGSFHGSGHILLKTEEMEKYEITGTPLRIAGFGRDEPECIPKNGMHHGGGGGGGMISRSESGSYRLREGKVAVLSILDYPELARYFRSETMLLAGGNSFPDGSVVDSCKGDSGGPLYHRYENTTDVLIVGLVSWGIGCGCPRYPGVYTRLSASADWISSLVS